MKSNVIEMKLTNDIGSIDNPCAKALDEIMTTMMDVLVKNLADEETGLTKIPPQALIVMMTNNIFMNLFLRFYSGSMTTMRQDAEELCDHLKEIMLDCLEKVFTATANEKKAH